MAKTRLKGLSRIEGKDPGILILGTFPGKESINATEYYADSKNSFRDIIAKAYGKSLPISYPDFEKLLKDKNIAVWDVFESCERVGSSDKNIINPILNKLEDYIKKHPTIRLVIFNGNRAADEFRKLYLPVPILIAPSTSGQRHQRYLPKSIEDIWIDFLLNHR